MTLWLWESTRCVQCTYFGMEWVNRPHNLFEIRIVISAVSSHAWRGEIVHRWCRVVDHMWTAELQGKLWNLTMLLKPGGANCAWVSAVVRRSGFQDDEYNFDINICTLACPQNMASEVYMLHVCFVVAMACCRRWLTHSLFHSLGSNFNVLFV